MQKHLFLVENLIILLLLWILYRHIVDIWWQQQHEHDKPRRKRQLHPRSPRDCQECCIEHFLEPLAIYSPPPPWHEVKSTQGRPKTYDSEGRACMNPECIYYKITDSTIHALRHDGKRNQDPTSQWECGACLQKRTAWLGTIQYRLKTPSSEVSLALHLQMKGLGAADISEVLGRPEKTIQRWLDRAGEHSVKLHKRYFKDIIAQHIQLDELVAKVRHAIKRPWVWTAVDVQSKLLLAWVIGHRTQADANRLLHQVKNRLSDKVIPAFISDGLNFYFYAITPHFGFWSVVEGKRKPVWNVDPRLLYGQLKKTRSRYKLKHTSTRMLCGQRADMKTLLQQLGLSGIIQTAFVERLNLTLRHIVPALHRRTWALAHNIRFLRLRFAIGAAYYNFCRPHQSLNTTYNRKTTPAMAAGVTDHVWSVHEFVLHPVY